MISRAILATGSFVLAAATRTGHTLLLLLRSLPWLRLAPKRHREIASLSFTYGVRSLPVVIVVAAFTGMIVSLQTGIALSQYGQQQIMGNIVAIAMCREMGPFITGLILTATAGSSIAAEIGTMKVSEEIDALEVMSIPAEKFLVMPRVLALLLVCPALTLLTMILGTVGASVVAAQQLGVDYRIFFDNATEALRTPNWYFGLPKDVYTGLLKSAVFGVSIAAVACANGLRASGGALGVGRAARSAVIVSFLLILVFGYFMTWLFYR
jgi:phospholipid/cholesterol/gamma-HCH transport system permease protein